MGRLKRRSSRTARRCARCSPQTSRWICRKWNGYEYRLFLSGTKSTSSRPPRRVTARIEHKSKTCRRDTCSRWTFTTAALRVDVQPRAPQHARRLRALRGRVGEGERPVALYQAEDLQRGQRALAVQGRGQPRLVVDHESVRVRHGSMTSHDPCRLVTDSH